MKFFVEISVDWPGW